MQRHTVSFGQEVQLGKPQIEKFKITPHETCYLSILTVSNPDPILAVLHFIKGFGSFHCLGEGRKCCEIDVEDPRSRVVVPIIQYMNYGNRQYGQPVKFKFLELTQANYNVLVDEDARLKSEANPRSITQVDLVATGTPAGKGAKPDLRIVNGPCQWLSNQIMYNEAIAFLQRYDQLIMDSLGKDYTEDQLIQKLNEVNATNPGQFAQPYAPEIPTIGGQPIGQVPSYAPQQFTPPILGQNPNLGQPIYQAPAQIAPVQQPIYTPPQAQYTPAQVHTEPVQQVITPNLGQPIYQAPASTQQVAQQPIYTPQPSQPAAPAYIPQPQQLQGSVLSSAPQVANIPGDIPEDGISFDEIPF